MNYSLKKILGVSAALMVLPVMAACDNNTAQQTAPTEPTATAPDAGTGTATAPTADPTIAEVAAADTDLSTFNLALEASGLTEELGQAGPYTVFAPSNEAFEAIPEETRQQLLAPENREQLRTLLSYHVVPQELSAAQLQSGDVETLAGAPLTVDVAPDAQEVNVNNASVTEADLIASNGVVHVVDQVILPPGSTL
ncbi:MAG TPA: fasciclin domain-containing protein [Trichocoleus sp.]